MQTIDLRRGLLDILSERSELDVLLINPESTFAEVATSPIAMPFAALNLCSPQAAFMGDQDHEPNHGLLQVAGILKDREFRVDVVDLNGLRYLIQNGLSESISSFDYLAEIVRERRPKIVAFSAMTANLYLARRYAEHIRRLAPEIPIVLGGLATEADPSVFRSDAFDVLHIGPATTDLPRLFRRLMIEGRPEEGPILHTDYLSPSPEVAIRVSDIVNAHRRPDTPLSRAAYHLLPRELPLIPRIFSSRGCAAGCSFCSPAAALGYRVAMRTTDDVLAEILYLHENFEFDFWLMGDLTFHLANPQVQNLLRELSQQKIKPWWCQTQVKLTSRDRSEMLARAHCAQIAVGFEDFTTPEQAVQRKHSSFEKSVETCRDAKSAGLQTQSYWMFGFPDDTFDAAIRRIQHMCWFVRNELMDTTHISFLIPYPGTAYFDRAEDFGLSIDVERYAEGIGTASGYYNSMPVHSTQNLSAEQIFTLTRLAMASVSNEYHALGQRAEDHIVAEAIPNEPASRG